MYPPGLQSVGFAVHWDGDSGGCCMWEVCGNCVWELCVGFMVCGSCGVLGLRCVGVAVCGSCGVWGLWLVGIEVFRSCGVWEK